MLSCLYLSISHYIELLKKGYHKATKNGIIKEKNSRIIFQNLINNL